MDKERKQDLFRKMYKIRRFEETLLKLFSENKLSGTTHTCIGQEAAAVTAIEQIRENDIVFSNHRCHGHFIAYSDNIKILMAEIMGTKQGVCKGRGGSQHLCYRRFYSNGIQGGIVPNAVGMAWAEKLKGTDHIAMVFMGDGTLGEGVVYESFNIAAVFNIPVLFVIENNEYAMSTKRADAASGTIRDRLKAFDIACAETDDSDIERLAESFEKAVSFVRTQKKPFCQIVNTYRLAAHSKGDDFRDKEEVASHWARDPLARLALSIDERKREEIKKEIEEELQELLACVEEQALPCQIEATEAEETEPEAFIEGNPVEESLLNRESVKHVEQLNAALRKALENHQTVMLLGEDIRAPYGGAFKVTKGLSDDFPDRVWNMPISEAGFIGVSVGLALNGMRPIVEVMFGDFISLGFDQILNHATKYSWLYAGQASVPLLIRVPSGGGRGYGATHSQTLEKYFVGMPGLTIIAVSPLIDCVKLIDRVERTMTGPVLLIENKQMYGKKVLTAADGMTGDFRIEETQGTFPLYRLTLEETEKADAVLITYGEMLVTAMQAAKRLLLEEELLVDILCLTKISPVDYRQLLPYIDTETYIFTLEEGTKRAGWGAEVISGLCERKKGGFFCRIAAKDKTIPCSRLEESKVLPGIDDVTNAIREAIYGTDSNQNAQAYE